MRRVLPDLRSLRSAEEIEQKVREARPQARSDRKASAPRYAAMRVLDQDQEKLTSDGLPELSDPGEASKAGAITSGPEAPAAAVSASPPPQNAPAPAKAALRFSRRIKPVTRLPRGERWKERRLPRVCWSKRSRSAL